MEMYLKLLPVVLIGDSVLQNLKIVLFSGPKSEFDHEKERTNRCERDMT